MERNFVVNIDSIKKFSNEIKLESNELNDILNYLMNITNETKSFFDTPTAKVFNETLLDYLNNAKKPCQALDELSYKISSISNIYTNLSNTTKASLGDNV